ncbi:MauE/DoxX family redox-associated membrane protein [Desulfamplus magnetovallimortis]|nr:MauE/DoxX family redox-associated membrane protein [Desulfamplus magnetovallimortis]
MKIMAQIYKWNRWILGIIFIYAGGTKLIEPEVFAVLIDAYGIVPEQIVYFVAVALSAIEVLAGLGLMFDIRGSLEIIFGLTLLFLIILGYGIHMGLDVDCGCFGPEDPESRAFHGLKQAFFRDIIMLLDILWLYAWRKMKGFKMAIHC